MLMYDVVDVVVEHVVAGVADVAADGESVVEDSFTAAQGGD